MLASPSLRKRLTWYVVISLVTLTAMSGTAIYLGTTKEADEVFDAALAQTASILDGFITLESIETGHQQLQQALERAPGAHKYQRKLFFAVFDPSGNLLLQSSDAPELPAMPIEPGFSEFLDQRKKWLTFTLDASHDNLLIVVGERSDAREEITEYIGSGLLLPLLLLLPLVLWMLWNIVGVALRPLQAVADQVRQQDLRQLKTIEVDGVPREISPLVTALNQMIVDLDAAYLRERRFVSDASHELRNPLASLLINVDNAIEESYEREVMDTLRSMKVSIQRMSHLVSQLLALSNLEKGSASVDFETVDLACVCAGVVERSGRQAQAKSITLEWQMPDTPCELKGSRALLESLVTNLVDNAIRYCDEGCRVRVCCSRADGELLLSVDDSGPGLDADQRARAPGRFYRAGDTNLAGAGLGLSIVKTIALSHGGELQLSDSTLGGLCVSLRFKIA
jgi:two-component system sensor histidine kinase QseC